MNYTQDELDKLLKDNPALTVVPSTPAALIAKSDRAKSEGIHQNRSANHDDLVTQAKQYLQNNGYLVNIPRKARSKDGYCTPIEGNAGYFDITAIHSQTGHIIFIEVKTGEGRLSPEQERWFTAASKSRETVIVLRPDNWDELVHAVNIL